jgi:hypothetical protein
MRSMRQPSAKVKEAMGSGDYQRVARETKRLEELAPPAALERVFAFGEDEVLFDALACRWIVIAFNAGLLDLYGVGWAASRFEDMRRGEGAESKIALRKAARNGDTYLAGRDAGHEDTVKHLALVDEAIEQGGLDEGFGYAALVPYLPLDYALRLTILSADARDPRFEPCSRKFLIGVLRDVQPEILQAKKLADCLAHVNHVVYGEFARDGLAGVVRQLREDDPLDIPFNSLPE